MPKKVIVIGAGFSGLAAAGLLAQEGMQVTVIEKNSQCGGRAQVYEEKGFVFDMGPSWYLMPPAFEHLFNRLGKKPEDCYDLIRLDPSYQIYFKGGRLEIRPELSQNALAFDQLEDRGYEKVVRYLERAEKQYKVSVGNFLYRDYESVFDLLTPDFLIKGLKLSIFSSVEQLAKKSFESDILRKLMGYTMVFIGGSPDKTPGMYSLMSYIDLCQNVWYPMGGMNVPAAALEKIARDSGAEFIYDTPVTKILAEAGSVKGVLTDRGEIPADIVVSNADYHHTELDLLEQDERSYRESYWRKRTVAPSAFIIYLGLNKKLDQLLHHNLYFHDNWQEHFQTIFGQPQWPSRFSYYVCCPSRTDSSVAPEGHENLFFLVPVGPGLNDDDETRERFYGIVMDHFEGLIGDQIQSHLVVKRIFSHRDFIGAYNAWKGSAFGLAHTLLQSAVFRMARASKKVQNLYFTGQYTHPGVGIPMTLISAEVLADRIKKDHG
ncbi:phytoene desaturase family protein [Acidobacteriota bacterium]